MSMRVASAVSVTVVWSVVSPEVAITLLDPGGTEIVRPA